MLAENGVRIYQRAKRADPIKSCENRTRTEENWD